MKGNAPISMSMATLLAPFRLAEALLKIVSCHPLPHQLPFLTPLWVQSVLRMQPLKNWPKT